MSNHQNLLDILDANGMRIACSLYKDGSVYVQYQEEHKVSKSLMNAIYNCKVPRKTINGFRAVYDKDTYITVTYKVVDKQLILTPTAIQPNGGAIMPNPITLQVPVPSNSSTRLRELDLASQVQTLEARYTSVLQQREYLATCTADDTPNVITVNRRTIEVSQKVAAKIIALCDKELNTLEDTRKAELVSIDKLLEAAITWE